MRADPKKKAKKQNRSGREAVKEKKLLQQASFDSVSFLLRVFYIAMIDCNISVEKVREVRKTVNRYSKYIADKLVTLDYVDELLEKAGFNEEDDL